MNDEVKKNPLLFDLEEIFDNYELDLLWIKDLPSIKYLTGFTGSTANLLVDRKGSKKLLVDSRYTTQAGDECRKTEVREIKKPMEDLCAAVSETGAKRLGFEAQSATYADYRKLRDELSDVEPVAIDENLARLRVCKSAEELDKLRKANRVSYQAFQTFLEEIQIGMTEREAAWILDRRFRELGAEDVSFRTLVCSGPRSAVVHGQPTDKKFEKGDFVIIDRGVILNHYCSDETNTIVLGKASDKQKEVYRIVKTAHDKALELVRPGAKCSDIDAAAREYIDKKGFGSYFGHGTGHGVGLEVHEQPVISPRGEGVVEEGMVFSVEPGIYIPDWGGVRIEDVVVVTKDGFEMLTLADKKNFEWKLN